MPACCLRLWCDKEAVGEAQQPRGTGGKRGCRAHLEEARAQGFRIDRYDSPEARQAYKRQAPTATGEA